MSHSFHHTLSLFIRLIWEEWKGKQIEMGPSSPIWHKQEDNVGWGLYGMRKSGKMLTGNWKKGPSDDTQWDCWKGRKMWWSKQLNLIRKFSIWENCNPTRTRKKNWWRWKCSWSENEVLTKLIKEKSLHSKNKETFKVLPFLSQAITSLFKRYKFLSTFRSSFL